MNRGVPLEELLADLGYGPDSPMAAAMKTAMKAQRDFDASLRSATMTFTLDDIDPAALARFLDGEPSASNEPIDWGCCDDPRPRIHEQSGRLFCANCRVYLDVQRRETEREGTAPDDEEGEDE